MSGMTREEAKNVMENIWDYTDAQDEEKGDVVDDAIIEVLECLEKQIPKKPIEYIMRFICPNCESLEIEQYNDIGGSTFFDYCPDCGQKLDWTPPYKRTDRLKGE